MHLQLLPRKRMSLSYVSVQAVCRQRLDPSLFWVPSDDHALLSIVQALGQQLLPCQGLVRQWQPSCSIASRALHVRSCRPAWIGSKGANSRLCTSRLTLSSSRPSLSSRRMTCRGGRQMSRGTRRPGCTLSRGSRDAPGSSRLLRSALDSSRLLGRHPGSRRRSLRVTRGAEAQEASRLPGVPLSRQRRARRAAQGLKAVGVPAQARSLQPTSLPSSRQRGLRAAQPPGAVVTPAQGLSLRWISLPSGNGRALRVVQQPRAAAAPAWRPSLQPRGAGHLPLWPATRPVRLRQHTMRSPLRSGHLMQWSLWRYSVTYASPLLCTCRTVVWGARTACRMTGSHTAQGVAPQIRMLKQSVFFFPECGLPRQGLAWLLLLTTFCMLPL